MFTPVTQPTTLMHHQKQQTLEHKHKCCKIIQQKWTQKLEYLAVYGRASMGGLCMDCINRTWD